MTDPTSSESGTPGPESITRDQINRVLAAIASFYRARGVQFELSPQGAVVFPDEPTRGEMHIGNILARCQGVDASEWDAIVEDHLMNIEIWWEQEKLIADRLDDFEFISQHLGVQLWPEEMRDEFGVRGTVMRQDVPGALTTLVLDLPTALRTLRRSEIEAWDQPEATLFDMGIERVRRAVTPKLDAIDVGLTKPILVARAEPPEDTFVSVFSLTPEALPEVMGPFGALLGAPCRDVVVAHPLHDKSGPMAIPQMAAMLQQAVSTRPYAISASIWHHDVNGLVTPIGYEIADGTMTVKVPPMFQELLDGLPEAPEASEG